MKRTLLLIILLSAARWGAAQTPKWVDQSRQAVFSIITYDKQDKILSTGNGFFISPDGMALSDYSLFKGASRAVVIDASGKQLPVQTIQGINGMYDVIKFKVLPDGGKKVTALTVNTGQAADGSTIYLLPYSTQKGANVAVGKVKEGSSIGEGHYYYSLDLKIDDKMASCPVMNAEGEVIGIAQLSSGTDNAVSYAVSASYGASLTITPLSFNDATFSTVGIKKGLPETEEQAVIYIYMAQSALSPQEYIDLLNDFIALYPNNHEGYLRRAQTNLLLSVEDDVLKKAAADLERVVSLSPNKDDALFNLSKLIYGYQLTMPQKTFSDWTLERALTEVRSAIDIDPLPLYYKLEGDVLYAMQQYNEAFDAYTKVNESNLKTPETLFSAAKAKELAGASGDEVIALMDSCINLCGKPIVAEDAPYLLERARVYMNIDQPRKALADYDGYYDVLRGNVNDLFYYYREQAALNSRQYQRALDDIQRAIELNSAEVMYRLELAVVNMRIGRNEEALTALDAAAAIDANNSEIYRLKGLTYIQLKNNNEGCENLQKAKSMGNENVDALIEKYCK